MMEAIRMPDLDLFMPGFFDVIFRCSGQEFEQRIVVDCSFLPHQSLLFEKCSEVWIDLAEGQWLMWFWVDGLDTRGGFAVHSPSASNACMRIH